MKSLGRACFGLLVVSATFVFVACGDDDDSAPGGTAGTAGKGGHAGDTSGNGGAGNDAGPDLANECRVLGTLCHEADTGSGDAHECHELGHEGDGEACGKGFADCIGTCVEGSADKEPLCAALGELCHEVDDQDGPLHECHELGHVNDKDTCAKEFDHCATICLDARKQLEAGEGGAGGAGHDDGHTHEGGAGATAAAGGTGGSD